MIIHSAEFMLGAAWAKQFPQDNLPEIAFVGRSNVGKSSLINKLLGRKQLARVSNKPGKTRQINFYLINESFRFADLPGYGYAKVSHNEREEWRKLVETFLRSRPCLRGVIQIVDARHPDQQSDMTLSRFLFSLGVRSWIVANKMDKLKRMERVESLKTIKESHGKDAISVSAETGEGIEALWDLLAQWMGVENSNAGKRT